MISRSFSRRALLAGSVVALGAPRLALAQPMLTFVASPTFSPFSTGAEGDKIVGIYTDVLAAIGRKVGFTVDYRAVPWPRAQKMVETGDADGFITIPTPERQAYANFAGKPLYRMDDAVTAYYKGSPFRATIEAAHSLTDLGGAKIGEYNGSSHLNSFLAGNANVTTAKNTEILIKLLGAGRVDLVLEPREVVLYYAKLNGVTDQIVFLDQKLVDSKVNDFSIALRKSLPDSAPLIAKIEAAQEDMRAAGEIAAIMGAYV